MAAAEAHAAASVSVAVRSGGLEARKAPTSWADLGLPPVPEQDPAVPAFLSAAPIVLGVFSVFLFLLNAVGLFGEGPDLDALVEEWSKVE